MNPLIGRWQQPQDQAYAGLIFQFNEDGTFESEYPAMGITSSGTYSINEEIVYIDQSQHNLGLVGKFEGRYLVDGDTLKMSFGNPGESAPADVNNARIYLKI